MGFHFWNTKFDCTDVNLALCSIGDYTSCNLVVPNSLFLPRPCTVKLSMILCFLFYQ